MRRGGLIAVLILFCLAPCRAGAGHSRFTGTWKIDATRSESMHQDVALGPSTIVIRLTDGGLTIETHREPAGNSPEFHETLRFSLDGSETTNTGHGGVSVTARARWNGEQLVTETVRNVQGSTVTTHYVHTLSRDGREMTVDKTLTVQHGYQGMSATNMGHGTDVYVRVSK